MDTERFEFRAGNLREEDLTRHRDSTNFTATILREFF